MTALGFLRTGHPGRSGHPGHPGRSGPPGHSAEDDYPRIEQLLGSDIRIDLVHTDPGADAHGADTHTVDTHTPDTHTSAAVRRMGSADRLAAAGEQLRLAGAEAVVWASTSGSFGYGWEGAHEQVATLARTAGMPASSTSFAFVHAVRELGVRRVAVGATYPDETAALFADFLRAGNIDVTGVHGSGAGTAATGGAGDAGGAWAETGGTKAGGAETGGTATGVTEAGVAEAGAWGEAELLALARAADRPDAQALLLPGTALRTVAHIPALEKELGKPVLTANQVTVWEALRLADRRVNAPDLGALFTREPLVQVPPTRE